MAPTPEGETSGADIEPVISTDEDLIARLWTLVEELDDILEERRVALARPMRGSEKDNLRRQYTRQEARLRERIEAIKMSLKED